MHPLNPFLRAFFRSTIPAQCVPIQNHVLLVPVTESLINGRDRDSNLAYADIVSSEEFLGSHVLRVPSPIGSPASKDGPSVRDTRGKARQITTVNGRTVVVKETTVFSNKGFKALNQAQLLSDALYYTSNNESQPWLIYYISTPLIGTFQVVRITPAITPGLSPKPIEPPKTENRNENHMSHFSKKEITSFADLLANFPMIARQMQPGLDRVFREFGKELGKPLPPPPSVLSPVMSDSEAHVNETEETGSWRSRSPGKGSYINQESLPFNSSEYFEDDEDLMRRTLETAVTSAIDLFRLVDKQQLSLLGATTDLTGPLVERLIEKHVAQQVHDSLLFPRLCGYRQAEDAELDARIHQMENIDISQVGIVIEGGRQGKQELLRRLGRGVDEFRKIADAKCPQDMLEILLATIKLVTVMEKSDVRNGEDSYSHSEKQSSVLAINADVLVSLLLVVIIRSQVRHLQARLLYMQQYIYTDDVESGELGYALSTFEAVLTYLSKDSGALRRASARNKRLWTATKKGRVSDIKAILDPDSSQDTLTGHNFDEDECSSFSKDEESGTTSDNADQEMYVNGSTSNPLNQVSPLSPDTPSLAHVFPFMNWSRVSSSKVEAPPRKKVSMDMRSLSESSTVSYVSRTTVGSTPSALEGDTSIENLTKTQDPAGDSVPMMAVEARQPQSLKYLLSRQDYYPLDSILEDTNSDGTTLLSAAVQLAHTELVDIILDFISQARDSQLLTSYYAKADQRGRTLAHYLFSVPTLMSRLECALPWRQRDKNGQTPLFALCRSYDHPDYNPMVHEALTIAQKAQGDGKPLRLEDHVDGKGNTLLHVVSDPQIVVRILKECDCDPNATNDKRFTPLMMASKYGRVDLVRIFFGDPRVDVNVREMRGLTAVELAKDDEVRNRIDDLILFSNASSAPVDPSGRITTVVRSLFVEDASVRFIIKSGAPNPERSLQKSSSRGIVTYTITTCRRSIKDFENLIKFLKVEHPASYIPELPPFRTPFQIPSRPSRAILHEVQARLDLFLKILLAHPTFATHEMIWEFFLVPEMQTEMIEDRSRRKAEALAETIEDDYEPMTQAEIRDVEQIVSHAQDAVRALSAATRSLLRRGHILQHAYSDLADSIILCAYALSSLQPPSNSLPTSYVETFVRYAACISTPSIDSSPLVQFLTALTSSQSTTTAMLNALSRPGKLISNLNAEIRGLTRAHSSLASSSLPLKFNFPGLEESRQKSVRDLEQKISASTAEAEHLEKEIAWNKDVVVGELAGWTAWREKVGKNAIRAFVTTTLVREKERGRALERCLRSVKGG
ncbi:VPS9 domain-containing protein [Histoplasma capsulatum G186AR]|uniref:VPS9 domain-containing protein n=1 Tax=Ajellomyces capsulatus TaxID=5037 RepID=A0A8H8D3M9_AJECA|nr:VPS9 domain-containing protein [Histoplasma capsulatum]QSS67702.1 VPS9 domain-containing protein [Histoplasma capsulatum G186AR]